MKKKLMCHLLAATVVFGLVAMFPQTSYADTMLNRVNHLSVSNDGSNLFRVVAGDGLYICTDSIKASNFIPGMATNIVEGKDCLYAVGQDNYLYKITKDDKGKGYSATKTAFTPPSTGQQLRIFAVGSDAKYIVFTDACPQHDPDTHSMYIYSTETGKTQFLPDVGGYAVGCNCSADGQTFYLMTASIWLTSQHIQPVPVSFIYLNVYNLVDGNWTFVSQCYVAGQNDLPFGGVAPYLPLYAANGKLFFIDQKFAFQGESYDHHHPGWPHETKMVTFSPVTIPFSSNKWIQHKTILPNSFLPDAEKGFRPAVAGSPVASALSKDKKYIAVAVYLSDTKRPSAATNPNVDSKKDNEISVKPNSMMIYIFDTGNNNIISNFQILNVKYPGDIVFDDNDNIYFAYTDDKNGSIYQIAKEGNIWSDPELFKNTDSGITPFDLRIVGNTLYYVSDTRYPNFVTDYPDQKCYNNNFATTESDVNLHSIDLNETGPEEL